MGLQFTDNSMQVKNALKDAAVAYLYEAAQSVEGQVKSNTKVASGQLKGSWTSYVDESSMSATIGSPSENAIWEEFGTGEFALNGDGRRGGWHYKDDKGQWHHTYGKKPRRAFFNAFNTLKPALIRRAEQVIQAKLGD